MNTEKILLRNQIEKYNPFNEQEANDKLQFLKFIDTFDDVMTRKNTFGHFSSSAFVLNKDMNKMLAVYHNIFKGWIYPGGHADGIYDLLSVARREVLEETNQTAKVLDKEIFAIQCLPVKGHIKRGEYISSHTHYDVVYLLMADENLPLKYRPDESSGVRCVNLEDATSDEFCDFMIPVNDKLIKKLKLR